MLLFLLAVVSLSSRDRIADARASAQYAVSMLPAYLRLPCFQLQLLTVCVPTGLLSDQVDYDVSFYFLLKIIQSNVFGFFSFVLFGLSGIYSCMYSIKADKRGQPLAYLLFSPVQLL